LNNAVSHRISLQMLWYSTHSFTRRNGVTFNEKTNEIF